MTAPAGGPAESGQVYPVFIKRGDARAEVDRVIARSHASPAEAGLHKYFYVAGANQTVVMVTSRDAPLAQALRGRGWTEPIENS